MKKISLAIIVFLYAMLPMFSQYIKYVNPFIGTGGHGHTYPGATVPFGMVQLSPDTRPDGYNDWDGCSGYHYSDSIIYGFSHSHLSGTGIADYCDILLMPSNNSMEGNRKQYASLFSHAGESASPGYYSVELLKHHIKAELTCTERTGFHQYHFSEKNASVILDLTHRDKLLSSYIHIISNTKIEGLRRSVSWAADQYVYFAIEFSQPFHSSIKNYDGFEKITDAAIGDSIEKIAEFSFNGIDTLRIKCALSSVSCEGAWKNMYAEIPTWNFDAVKKSAELTWEKQLSKIEVSGGTPDEKINFYTALYHTMIVPNRYDDVDGNYRGRDLLIHNTENKFNYYTVFSLWDTYRAAHPLYTILEQKKTNDFINTFLKQYKQGGKLPVWELSSNETYTMIGYHSVSVIADAYLKGIKNYDTIEAYNAMKHSAMQIDFGLKYLKEKGFIESQDESESVSKTLEYSYDDWCIAQMGKKLNMDDSYNFYLRSKNWMNLFDGTFIRPRYNGGWYKPFDPSEVNGNYTEANAWQYTFYAPHDIGSLFPPDKQAHNFERLEGLFTSSSAMTGRVQSDITGLIGQYAHGNEPSHHTAYLFNYVNATDKTAYYVNKIRNDFYYNSPNGLVGNEDCGQMSAWYIFSALGFYPVCPGTQYYDAGTPLFDEIKIHLENGNTCTIQANGKSASAIYVSSIKINGTEISEPFIQHSDIMQGSQIEFQMTDKKENSIAGSHGNIVPAAVPRTPIINAENVFKDSLIISLQALDSSEKLIYNTEGIIPLVAPTFYSKPFTIYNSAKIMAVAKSSNGSAGRPVTAIIKKLSSNFDLAYLNNYNAQYTGGGDYALIDGIRGKKDFKTGAWQGWWGNNMEIIIDLGKEKRINSIRAGFLQDVKSWIWLPKEMAIYVSEDGENFTFLTKISDPLNVQSYKIQTQEMSAGFTQLKTRFIKIIAVNQGEIPAWHPGVGNRSWIFCDEIIIE